MRRKVRIKRVVRDFLLKRALIFGDSFSKLLINCGYLIQSSVFFNKTNCKLSYKRFEHYDTVRSLHELSKNKIVYLEFGVFTGNSFNYWLRNNKNSNSRFFGFDTFTGLPEDWGHIRKGHFTTNGKMPHFDDDRYRFYKGLFQETLPRAIEENKELLSGNLVINFDADLYSSTLYTLIRIWPFLKKGDILLFDEFFSVVNASTEFRAFLDFETLSGIKYQELSKTTSHFAIMII